MVKYRVCAEEYFYLLCFSLLLGKDVSLRTWFNRRLKIEQVEVKVKENWRQNEGLLKYYGYGGQIRAV